MATNKLAVVLQSCVWLPLPAQQFTTTPVPIASLFPWSVATGDLDGDGTLDLVLATGPTPVPGGEVEVVSRLASGTWGTRTRVVTERISGVVVAEITGDGRPDLLVAQTSPAPQLQRSLALFSFSRSMQATLVSTTPWPPTVYGDLAWLRGDGDALPDLFSFHDTSVAFHRNLGGGVFAAPAITAIAPSASLEASWIADFTGDGFADAVYLDRVPGQVRLYPGDGTGGFLPAVVTPLPFYVPGGIASLAADLDGDNRRDLIVQGRVLLAAGTGAFQITSTVLPAPLGAGDFDGDGRTDVLCAGPFVITPYLQQPGMSFVAGTPIPAGNSNENYSVLDVDQDGRLDVLRLLTSTVLATKVILATGVLPHAQPFVFPFGIGTPGCRGHVGLTANLDPTFGQLEFALTAANAPASAPGIVLASHGPLTPQLAEPFGLGVRVCLPLTPAPPTFATFDSNSQGQARLAVPISTTGLGFDWQFQGIWLAPAGDGACSASPFGFVSSNAVHVQVH